MSEWIRGLGRSARMYFPVHFLPALIFKLQRLKAAPQAFVTTLSLAALRSSVFLTSYQVRSDPSQRDGRLDEKLINATVSSPRRWRKW